MEYNMRPTPPAVPDGEFGIACDSSLLVHTWREYAGNRVYDNGVISRLLFDGGYVSFRDSVPTYHYYIRDYLGNNRVVADAHGNVEEVNHYYPWRAHGRQPQHRPAALQVHKKGAGPHSRPGLVRPRCPPLRPVTPYPASELLARQTTAHPINPGDKSLVL